MILLELLHFTTALYVIGGYITFVLCRWIYRISPLHPLAKYPTPSRLGAMTEWYEFYWNVIRNGSFVPMFEKWHKELGPIIRIGPNELHINDPAFYYTLYSANYKFRNYRPFYKFVGTIDGISTLADPVAHQKRRSALHPFFSTAQVQKLDGNIQGHIENLVDIVSEHSRDADPNKPGIYLSKLFRCLTVDIISEYAYSESNDTLKDSPDALFFRAMRASVPFIWANGFFWPLQNLLAALPYWALKKVVSDELMSLLDMELTCAKRVDELIRDPTKAKAKTTHATIFSALLDNDSKTPRKTLVGEATILIAAGMETTSSALTTAIYAACLNPDMQQKLHQEAVEVFPSREDITAAKCQNLPYLSKFVKENFRYTPPFPGRLPRIVPKGGTVCGETFIPEGVSSYPYTLKLPARLHFYNVPKRTLRRIFRNY
ncbi:hypothetical protein ABW19_dt0205044 [Dactylella cylindrospora]|nr:hypothetical protein ABW19_dt0205044 [Dactylella cylindrospora]